MSQSDNQSFDYAYYQTQILQLSAENHRLKEELEVQTIKHRQWKELAMTFHDSLWSLMNEYGIANKAAR